MYAPGSSADPAELDRLCRIVARSGKLYATHMRSYSAGLVDAVREQLALARATGCRLQISHLQAAGRANWELQERALDEIEAARSEGIDVEFDIYPYQCGSTVLTQWLPGLERWRAAGIRCLRGCGIVRCGRRFRERWICRARSCGVTLLFPVWRLRRMPGWWVRRLRS